MKSLKNYFQPRNLFTTAANVILFILACGLIALISRQHLAGSREFYFWDNAGYHDIVLSVVDRLQTQPKLDLLRDLYHSFSDEISNLFALPLIPFIYLFGESRFVFVLSLAFCYLLPAVMLSAWLCAWLAESYKVLIFWGATYILLLSPFCWISILDGRPDIGGAALVLISLVLVGFAEHKNRWGILYVASGAILAFSLLFRRYFMLALPAFGLALLITPLEKSLSAWVKSNSRWSRFFAWVVGVGGILTTFGRPFLNRYFDTTLKQSYSSYEVAKGVGIWVTAKSFISFYGVIWWFVVVLGVFCFVKSKRNNPNLKKLGLFLLFFVLCWVVLWTVLGARARHNYIISIYWLFPLALTQLVFFILDRYGPRKTVPFCIAIISTLLLMDISRFFPIYHFKSVLFPEPLNRVVRTDYDQVIKLIKDLKREVKNRDKILVAGSSSTMTEGVLIDAENQLVGRKNRKLNIMGIMHADSYRHIPLEELVEADWVVVPTPFQWHMRPDVQQCVQVLHDAFKDKWKISLDFEKSPKEYSLADGVTISLFHRIRPTSDDVAKETEEIMRRRIIK